MTSMSYCRFQNTLEELQACKESLDEIEGNLAELSKAEAKAADRLIQLCRYIAEIHGDPETINDQRSGDDRERDSERPAVINTDTKPKPPTEVDFRSEP